MKLLITSLLFSFLLSSFSAIGQEPHKDSLANQYSDPIQEPSETIDLESIYPIPTADHLNIKFKEKIREALVYITDQQGKVHRIFKVNQVEYFRIDLRLKSGFYMLNITEGNRQQSVSFLVM